MTAERKQAEEYLRDNKISGCDFVYTTGFENMVGLLESYASLKVAEAKQELDKTSYLMGVEDGRKMATKEMYPKEFVEWKDTHTIEDKITKGKIRYFVTNMDTPMDWYALDELFEYWKQNIRK